MKGIDYTKSLNETRDKYAKAIADNNRAHERSITNLKENHNRVEKNQRENYVQERDKQQEHYERGIDRVKSKTAQVVKDKQEQYNRELEQQKEKFFQGRQDQQLKFQTKIAELDEDYNKNINLQKENHDKIQQRARDNADDKVNVIRDEYQDQVDKYLERTKLSSDDVKRQARIEKRALVRDQNDKVHEIRKENTEKVNFMKDAMRKDIDRLRDVQEQELKTRSENQEKNFTKLRKVTNDKVDNAFKNFASLNKDRTEQQIREIKQNQKNTSEVVENIKTDYNKQLDGYKSKVERKLEIQTGDDKFALTQMGVKNQNEYDQKLDENKKKTQKKVTELFDKMDDDRKLNQKFNQEKSEIFANRFREQEKEFFQVRSKDMENMRKSEEKLIKDQEYILEAEKEQFKTKLDEQSDDASVKIKNLKENFSLTLEDLNKKNHGNLKQMRADTEKDKSTFMKTMREQHSTNLYDMRQKYRDSINLSRSELNRKIASLQRENDALKRTMENKVQDILTKSKMELDFNKEVLDDRIKANLKTANEERKNLLNDFRNQIFSIREKHAKEMEEVSFEQDRKMREMTQVFQNTIAKINHENLQNKDKMLMEHKLEFDRLKQQFETEKVRMADQFKNQMDDMGRAYKEQLKNLQDFKDRTEKTYSA